MSRKDSTKTSRSRKKEKASNGAARLVPPPSTSSTDSASRSSSPSPAPAPPAASPLPLSSSTQDVSAAEGRHRRGLSESTASVGSTRRAAVTKDPQTKMGWRESLRKIPRVEKPAGGAVPSLPAPASVGDVGEVFGVHLRKTNPNRDDVIGYQGPQMQHRTVKFQRFDAHGAPKLTRSTSMSANRKGAIVRSQSKAAAATAAAQLDPAAAAAQSVPPLGTVAPPSLESRDRIEPEGSSASDAGAAGESASESGPVLAQHQSCTVLSRQRRGTAGSGSVLPVVELPQRNSENSEPNAETSAALPVPGALNLTMTPVTLSHGSPLHALLSPRILMPEMMDADLSFRSRSNTGATSTTLPPANSVDLAASAAEPPAAAEGEAATTKLAVNEAASVATCEPTVGEAGGDVASSIVVAAEPVTGDATVVGVVVAEPVVSREQLVATAAAAEPVGIEAVVETPSRSKSKSESRKRSKNPEKAREPVADAEDANLKKKKKKKGKHHKKEHKKSAHGDDVVVGDNVVVDVRETPSANATQTAAADSAADAAAEAAVMPPVSGVADPLPDPAVVPPPINFSAATRTLSADGSPASCSSDEDRPGAGRLDTTAAPVKVKSKRNSLKSKMKATDVRKSGSVIRSSNSVISARRSANEAHSPAAKEIGEAPFQSGSQIGARPSPGSNRMSVGGNASAFFGSFYASRVKAMDITSSGSGGGGDDPELDLARSSTEVSTVAGGSRMATVVRTTTESSSDDEDSVVVRVASGVSMGGSKK
jgi:hypothetical protein